MRRRLVAYAPWMLLGVAMASLAGCGTPDAQARAGDPYQACLDHYRTGDLGPHDTPGLQRAFPTDRLGPRRDVPDRLNWPRSAQDRCDDLRARGRL